MSACHCGKQTIGLIHRGGATHRSRAGGAPARWAKFNFLEYQTYTSAHQFDTLVTGLPLAACEILRIYIVKLNLTHFSASRQDKMVLYKKIIHQISEEMGHARGVGCWLHLEISISRKKQYIVIYAIRAQPSISSIFKPICMKFWLHA